MGGLSPFTTHPPLESCDTRFGVGLPEGAPVASIVEKEEVTTCTKNNGSFQGTIGCTPNSVPMVFIVFFRDSWGLYNFRSTRISQQN